MKLWLVALAGVAGLAGLITLTALSSFDGAPRGTILDKPLPAGRVPPVPVTPRCAAAGGKGPSAVRLGGSCTGVLRLRFGCVHEGEIEALSAGADAGGGRRFYLTVLASDFAGPGDYYETDLSAQLVGRDAAPRWSTEGEHVGVHLSPSGVYRIDPAVLLPVVGTPASGVIEVEGPLRCA